MRSQGNFITRSREGKRENEMCATRQGASYRQDRFVASARSPLRSLSLHATSLRRNFVGRPFPRVYHVVKGTSCRFYDEWEDPVYGSYRDGVGERQEGEKRRGENPSEPKATRFHAPLPRNVIPIATTITFNRAGHAIIGRMELIYKLSP